MQIFWAFYSLVILSLFSIYFFVLNHTALLYFIFLFFIFLFIYYYYLFFFFFDASFIQYIYAVLPVVLVPDREACQKENVQLGRKVSPLVKSAKYESVAHDLLDHHQIP